MEEAMVMTEDIRKAFEPRIQQLNAIAEELIATNTKDEYGYLVTGISKLTSMMLDCEQYNTEIDPDGEAILTERVVKVNRYIKNVFLDLHGVDRTVVGGLFIAVPVYLLPANKVNKAIKNRYKSVINPEEYGLPSEEVCNYCTFKPISATAYMAVAKFEGNNANELITTARNYDYVYLKK